MKSALHDRARVLFGTVRKSGTELNGAVSAGNHPFRELAEAAHAVELAAQAYGPSSIPAQIASQRLLEIERRLLPIRPRQGECHAGTDRLLVAA